MPDAAGLGEAAAAALEVTFRETGGVPAPMVHILVEDRARPYFGYVTCRPFRAGADAVTAIRLMGALPSTLRATRLVIAWEHSDMCVAIGAPGVDFPTGLMVLDAAVEHHVLRWTPFRQAVAVAGSPGSGVRWGELVERRGAVLPDPVAQLLDGWRMEPDADPAAMIAEMDAVGYEVHRVASFDLPRRFSD